MKLFNRKIVVFMVFLVTMSLLAACGGAATPEPAEPAAAPAEEESQAAEESTVAEEPKAAEEEPEAAEEAAAEAMEAGTPYKIGFIAAITGPGAGLGVPERNTAEMVAAQLEEAGGVIGPDGVKHSVEVIILDSESNPDTAAATTSRLISEDEVDVLVAGTLSGNSMAMVPLATEAEVALISMASARAIVEDPETGEARTWVFKTPQENTHNAVWQAEYMKAQGITTVCYLHENSGFGQDVLAQGEKAFADVGIEIIYVDSFERTDTEFPQIVSVQGAGCDAVVIGSIPPGSASAQQAVRDAMPDIPIIQGHGNCTPGFIDLAPEVIEGTPLPCGRLLVADGLPDNDPQKGLLLDYISNYSDFTGGEAVSTFGGHAYDALLWAIEGLSSLEEGASLVERRAGVRDYIETEITDWPGTGGVFNITPNDHLGLEYTGLTFVRVQDGTFVYFPPEDW